MLGADRSADRGIDGAEVRNDGVSAIDRDGAGADTRLGVGIGCGCGAERIVREGSGATNRCVGTFTDGAGVGAGVSNLRVEIVRVREGSGVEKVGVREGSEGAVTGDGVSIGVGSCEIDRCRTGACGLGSGAFGVST